MKNDPATSTEPAFATAELTDFPGLWDRFRISRTRAYNLIGEEKIRAVKLGSRTLIDVGSVRVFLSRQPVARIRPPAPPKAA
jgi:hypothetical protein